MKGEKNKRWLVWICAGFGLVLVMGFVKPLTKTKADAEPKKTAPNVLFILVDDLGWTDLGAWGSTFYESPNVDALTTKGMKFTNAYAACPVCSPTRASIMTGKYPARLQTTDWFGAPQPEAARKSWPEDRLLLPAEYLEELPLEEVTLAEALKQNGYKTFFAGKWHLGDKAEFWPEKQGFDINKGGWTAGHPSNYFAPYKNPRLSDGPEGENLTDRLARETSDFIKENKEGPFLAYLSFYSVHTPLQAPKELIEKYEKKKQKLGLEDQWCTEEKQKVRLSQCLPVYAAMVESMDMAVGKVMNTLKVTGLEKNTIVIFMSDNGGLSTSGGHPTSNLPLRAGKGWLYEGGIREPMVIYWPGAVASGAAAPNVAKAGSVSDLPVMSTDFYPTILEMAGLPALPKQHVDGVSLVPILKGKEMKRGPLYWHYPHYGNQGGLPSAVVRDGDWKLIEWFEPGREPELFNLKNDLGEQQNLAKKYPDKTKTLYAQLKKWQREVGRQGVSGRAGAARGGAFYLSSYFNNRRFSCCQFPE